MSAVPHLTTALSGPLQRIETHLLDNQARIEAWLRQQWIDTPPPFYCSVDLRNAGFKLAPVDTNLFPAGFNNLNPQFLPLCVQAMQTAIGQICPTACNLLLIPESHTRNPHYFESLAALCDIIARAGFEVRIGTLAPGVESAIDVPAGSGRTLRIEPLAREGARLMAGEFNPCVVLLNNDLSDRVPEILDGIEQPVIPPPALGWNRRLKSGHFAVYQEVAREFGALVDLDPWLYDPLFRNCGEVEFMTRTGEDCLLRHAETLLRGIELKYREYGIRETPFIVVKADAGTYGMAVMTVQSPDELRQLNRKQRSRMAARKGGQPVTRAILQEGVHTFETWGPARAVAEPVVYMIDQYVVGGFYRVHTEKRNNENLNAPGMHFQPLGFAESCITPDRSAAPDADPNRFYAYGVIGRLALLAAAREIARVRA